MFIFATNFLFLLVSFVNCKYEKIANELELIRPENIIVNVNSENFYNFIDVSPLEINNNDVVTVKFSSKTPSSTDWIGAYSPLVDTTNISQTVPVKYAWCKTSIDYLTMGIGILRFNFTNLREPIGFYYFTNGLTNSILQDMSYTYGQVVQFKNPNQQLKPRVVPDPNPNNLQLVWSSANSTKPVLLWGIESNKYQYKVPGRTNQITQSDLCGEPATTVGWHNLGQIHSAIFTNVTDVQSKKIYYKFGDLTTSDFSQEYILNIPGIQSEKTTAILFDDLGRGSLDDSYT